MANCEDFKTETTAMHELMALLGIGMEQTLKGQPELASRGIEYCWDKSKYEFRKHNNLMSGKANFEKRVMTALKSAMLRRSRAFQRKAKRLQAGVSQAHRWVRGRGRGAVCRH
jgi:hypothetical protein